MSDLSVMDTPGSLPASFTARELEILHLVALGLSNRDIAEELVIAAETVRWYTKQIYGKLSVTGRIQAVNRARQLGLLQDAHPPTGTAQALPQHNLPQPMTAFIGRSHELAEVRQLLQTTRLLTLTGVGGTGKTRLALQLAAEVAADFAAGLRFVDLAPVSDAALVARAIASALGLIENPNEALIDTLRRALSARQMLLLIDNFEHVIQAAPLVADLLAAAPDIKALVTSREALRLSGEQEYPVPPLSLASSEAISIQTVSNSEAGDFFVRRAQMMLPRFEVTGENAPAIAQICARLDGLPLAIELAAARCKLLSPQALLERLDSRLDTLAPAARDAPARQRTLRETIDWSYNLLDAAEKTLFARLAVFRGGRSLEAIEAVCGPDLRMDVLDGLASLVDKNLIQHKETANAEPRFVMLETIHEYARERLAASGEADTIFRHYAEYFVDLAERAEPELRLADYYRWSQVLELELNNLRAVLEWSLAEGDVTLGLRLAGALYLFWWAYGYHVEGRYWTSPLLERIDEAPAIYQAKFLLSAELIASLYDLDTSTQLLLRMLEIARRLGEKMLSAWALTYLGFAMQQEPAKALAAAEEGLALFRELDYQPGMAQALDVVGLIATKIGDYARAEQAFDECLRTAQQTGETRHICFVYQKSGPPGPAHRRLPACLGNGMASHRAGPENE